jgi:hypothetical protein
MAENNQIGLSYTELTEASFTEWNKNFTGNDPAKLRQALEAAAPAAEPGAGEVGTNTIKSFLGSIKTAQDEITKMHHHEDVLCKNRLTWFGTLQGFLWTSLALVWSGLTDRELSTKGLLTAIACMGIGVCVSIFYAFVQWERAMSRLTNKFDWLQYLKEKILKKAAATEPEGRAENDATFVTFGIDAEDRVAARAAARVATLVDTNDIGGIREPPYGCYIRPSSFLPGLFLIGWLTVIVFVFLDDFEKPSNEMMVTWDPSNNMTVTLVNKTGC